MHSPLRLVIVTLMLAFLTAGCSVLGGKSECPCGAKAGSDGDKAPELSAQRLLLSQGYSLLYMDAAKLDLVEWVLYVKAESEPVDSIVAAISEFGGELKKDLERIAKDYPGVRIDLDPLPEMEKRKRSALGKDRAKEFAPVIGRGGRAYERTVLIAFSNAFNHERHLCQVMAEEEPDAGLKKFLLATEKGYAGLYDRTIALLDKSYFKNPEGPSKDS